MKICLHNASQLVTDADTEVIADALAHSLAVFADHWDLAAPQVGYSSDPATAGLGEEDCLIVVLDDADQAGALGYHDVTPAGQPYARVFARDSIAGLTGVDPSAVSGPQPSDVVLACVAPVADHEAKEACADRFADEYAGPDATGNLWALEVADPCESDLDRETVTLADGSTTTVTLSNFVLPAFFDAEDTTGPWDYLGKLPGPFSVGAGGYAILQQAGEMTEVFGDELPAWRRAQHEARHPASRTGRRLSAATGAQEPTDAPPAPDTAPTPSETSAAPTGTVDEEPQAPAAVGGHPEPHVITGFGAGTALIEQDNVSEPGVQVTRHVHPDSGEILAETRHDG